MTVASLAALSYERKTADGKHMTTRPNTYETGGFRLLLVLLTAALLYIVWPFLRPLMWAALAAIMFQPLYGWFLVRRPGKTNQAALASLTVITIAVVIPAMVVGSLIVEQVTALVLAFRDGEIDPVLWLNDLQAALPDTVRAQIEASGWADMERLQERAQTLVSESIGAIAGQAMAIGSGALSFVLAFGIALYALFFLLRDGRAIARAIVRALPVERSVAQRLAERFGSIVRATIKGSIVVGLVQGALGAITFAIVGLPLALLFGLLMALASLIPALGPALIWVPAALWLIATGQVWQAIVVIVSGVAVIGAVDNVLRPILVGRDTGIPDWIILVTTLGGIAAVGLGGIVLGPVVAGLFLAAWQVAAEERAHDAEVAE